MNEKFDLRSVKTLMGMRLFLYNLAILVPMLFINLGVAPQIFILVALVLESVTLALMYLKKLNYPSYCLIYEPFISLVRYEKTKTIFSKTKDYKKYCWGLLFVTVIAFLYLKDTVIGSGGASTQLPLIPFIVLLIVVNSAELFRIISVKEKKNIA